MSLVFWDPLGHGEPLPLARRFFPLGFPLDLRTNSEDALGAAQEGFGEFVEAFDAPAVELRAIVQPRAGQRAPSAGDQPVFRAQGHLLSLVLDAGNFAVCDLEGGLGCGWFTPAVAQDRLFLSFHFLEVMAYLCLCQRYVTPVHAACVARDGAGILLVGGSRAGKSSLAWACARAGLTYLSDDVTWLLRNGSQPALIGKPQRMRFRPDALDLLPELGGLPQLATVIGKQSFEIRTADVAGIQTARRCRPARVIFLERQAEGPAALAPVGRDEARRRLALARNITEARVWAEQEASLERLLTGEAAALRYSRLDDAVERILTLL